LDEAGLRIVLASCDGCDGSGIRPDSNMPNGRPDVGPPPAGYTIIERCDACDKYQDDLFAAQAWGDDAHWQNGDQPGKPDQAIARPRPLTIGQKLDAEFPALCSACKAPYRRQDAVWIDGAMRNVCQQCGLDQTSAEAGQIQRPAAKLHNFTLAELGNTYVDDTDRFIVSLIVGYGPESPSIKTPHQAVGAAFALTTDMDSSHDTQWYCFDRKDGSLHLIEQGDATEPVEDEQVQP
jgi:hypothetical protein